MKAKEFYVDYLGYSVEWEHRFEDGFPLYLEIRKEDCTIHLTEHHGDCSPGAAARIETQDLGHLHKTLSNKTYQYARPSIDDTPWDTQEMSIKDPFGNRLTFFESEND